MLRSYLKRGFLFLALVGLLNVQVACGTILHPERKGQEAGRIDPAIAILDGVGLLFFFIPGVIAYAVDFSNGTIYLPPEELEGSDGNQTSSLEEVPEELKTIDGEEMVAIQVDRQKLRNKAYIERVIKERTGRNVDLDDEHVDVQSADGNAPFAFRAESTRSE